MYSTPPPPAQAWPCTSTMTLCHCQSWDRHFCGENVKSQQCEPIGCGRTKKEGAWAGLCDVALPIKALRVRLPGAHAARARRAQRPNECSSHLSQWFTPNITPSSSPGTLSTGTLYDCWQSNNFPFFGPTNRKTTCTLPLLAPSWPPDSKSKNPPLVRDGPLKWPHRRVGVIYPNSRGHAKGSENFARRANVLSLCVQVRAILIGCE